MSMTYTDLKRTVSYEYISQHIFSVLLKHLVDSVKIHVRTSQIFGLSLSIKPHFLAAHYVGLYNENLEGK